MSDLKPWGSERPAKRTNAERSLGIAIRSFVGLGAIAALYVMGLAACKPPSGDEALFPSLAHGSMAKLKAPDAPATYPDTRFVDQDGKSVKLADFKGQAVILNLWATWCAPCVKEMPTLAALQSDFQGRPVKVIALSNDPASQTDKAKAFIAAHAPLSFYQDPHLVLATEIKPHIEGFPTTMLYNKKGELEGVLQGDTDWSTPEAQAVIRALLRS